MGNSGNLGSPNNAANVLDADGAPASRVTVGRYTSRLRDAPVFCEARRCDIRGKKRLGARAKRYVCDSGMRRAALGTSGTDRGRACENAVFWS